MSADQRQILLYLQGRSEPSTTRDLRDHFGVDKGNLTRKLKAMNRIGIIDIEIEDRKWKISARRNTYGI